MCRARPQRVTHSGALVSKAQIQLLTKGAYQRTTTPSVLGLPSERRSMSHPPELERWLTTRLKDAFPLEEWVIEGVTSALLGIEAPEEAVETIGNFLGEHGGSRGIVEELFRRKAAAAGGGGGGGGAGGGGGGAIAGAGGGGRGGGGGGGGGSGGGGGPEPGATGHRAGTATSGGAVAGSSTSGAMGSFEAEGHAVRAHQKRAADDERERATAAAQSFGDAGGRGGKGGGRGGKGGGGGGKSAAGGWSAEALSGRA